MSIDLMLDHLLKRHMNIGLYSGAYVDEASATFALWNLSGQMVGYQTYRPDKPKLRGRNFDPMEMRYYTYISRYGGADPATTAWGLETLYWPGPTYLCEGIFDACRLHSHGFSALAMLGSNPVHLASWLRTLPYELVSVVQGDEAGKKLAKFGDKAVYLPPGRDVGDLSETEFLQTFKNNRLHVQHR